MRTSRVIGVVAAAALLATTSGCGLINGGGGKKSPSPTHTSGSAAPTGADGLPSPVGQRVWQYAVRGTTPVSVVTSIYGVYRQGDHAALQFGVTLASGAQFGQGVDLTDRLQSPIGHPDDPSSLSATEITLVDSQADKAYLVARDSQTNGKCLCPRELQAYAGATTVASATFAAPAADKSAIDVWLPSLGYFPNVPITNGAPPTPTPVSPAPNKRGVLVAQPSSTGPVAQARVVDIDAPVANLDLSVTQQKDKVTLDANVLFAFNKASLTSKAKSRIAEAAAVLRKNAHGQVEVNGYTDSKGSNAYNLDLSRRRAEAVRKALAAQLAGTGITLVAKGYGEARPVAPNTVNGRDNPHGRALNRRVEIVYHR